MLLTVISYAGSSQTTDTICLPLEQAKKVLADAKQKPVLQEQISLLRTDISLLNLRIVEKDGIIKDLEKKDGNNAGIIRELQDQKELMQKQIDLHLDQVKTMERMIRREKRKRFWATAAGVLTTAGAIFLTTK